jgi:uncharacterized protein YjiK
VIPTTTRGFNRVVPEIMRRLAPAGRSLAFGAVVAVLALIGSAPADVSAQSAPAVFISEVHPAGSGNGTYNADWFEVTNAGAVAVDVTGWKMDDNSNAFASAVALRGVTSIPAGKSAVFFENSTVGLADSTVIASFSTAWFGSATPPDGFLIGAYGGAGVGLSTSGDAVNLFDAAGNRITGVSFGAAVATATFDNTAGIGSATLPLPTLSALSVAGVNGAFRSFNGAETGSPGRRIQAAALTGLDLSTYVRVGRFDLPEPTRTVPPPNSLLAQEVSAVTYDRDTDTLFVVGDGGTSIVQVTKTGQLIDSMTLAPGGSPQGTEFYDTEGLTYVGGGKFVMTEERDRQLVQFTYAAGTTLTRSAAQTVKLGTFVDNIGLEGVSYDPQTAGFIVVKETQPEGIFQTGVDFAAGTATNGSPTTVNSINVFDPALANLLDFADVYALSNLQTLTGPDSTHLLILSQESGKIVHVDRSGVVYNSLTIHSDPGNPLSVPSQQHEGLTMDGNGVLYVVSENGGGDFDHPQLWVYAPSLVPNQAPTGLALNNQINTIAENTSTAARLKVADVVIADDGLGTNNLTVTGTDATAFEVDDTGLYIKAGTALDFETKSSYIVTVAVDDSTVGATPDATAGYTLSITDVVEQPPSAPSLVISEVAPWSSGNSPVAADWFEVTNTGSSAVNLAGWKMDDNSNAFASAVALNGVASIAPGESVIFLETGDLATVAAAFRTTWFGGNPPSGLQIGSYSGGGVGLSTGGDAVNLYDASGTFQAGVTFGAAPANAPFATFDNAAGLNNTAISLLSAVAVHGAFAAANDASEIGSPGTVGPVGNLIISEVAPWSSGNSPVGADWFEVTNVGGAPVDVTGWKVDDSSESFAAAVPMSGVATIAPGESVIFIETANLAGAATAFVNTWFGASAPAGLQIGSYSGGGVGLSTGGDAVVLYNPSGVLQAKVSFGVSPAGPSFATFDNAAGLNSAAISQLSARGVNGAFVAASDANEIGSPGTTAGDVTPPTIEPHADIVVSAVDASGATAIYAPPAAHDDVDLSVAVVCAPASGGLFALGLTPVSCHASDAAGNAAAPVTFMVRVVDTTPPVLAPLANITTTTSGSSAVVTFVASATDNVSIPANIAISCQPASGAAFPIGTTPVSCAARDEAGNVAAAATFTVTVSENLLARFVALSRDLTWMRAGSTAVTGDVGAIERRRADHGGDADTDDGGRDDVTVRIGVGATMAQPSSRVIGDTVLLLNRSSIFNAIDNVLLARKNSTIRGTITNPMAVPFVVLPAFPAVQAGTQAISVAKNKTVTLAPGAYGAVQVATGGTLVLNGGLYQVQSIELAASATIMFRAATELRVSTELSSKAKAKLILDPSVAGLTASQVAIYVAGRDEDCHDFEADDDGDDAGPVSVHIGAQNVVQANIYAARGTVWLKSRTQATGAFLGVHVRVGVNAVLTLDSAFK